MQFVSADATNKLSKTVFKNKIQQSTYLVSTQQRRYRSCFSLNVFLQGGVGYGMHNIGKSKPTFIYYLKITGGIVYNFILTQANIHSS